MRVTGQQWLFVGLAAGILLFPLVRKIWTVARQIPPGKRLKVAAAVFKPSQLPPMSSTPPPEAPPHIVALYSPAEPRRVVPIEVWHAGPQLVTNILKITDPTDTAYGVSLDVDGSAVLVRRVDTGGYSLRIVRLDGSFFEVAREPTGLILDASLDQGACAWWHVDPIARRAEIRVWSAEEGLRSLGSRNYELDAYTDEPAGWMVLAGGTVVACLAGGVRGDIIAAREGHPMVTVGPTHHVTVRRDVAAEWRGVPRVSVSLSGTETDNADQLTSLDLSSFPPTATPLRRGLILPGGTVAYGEPVVQWMRSGVLELPGGLSVPMAGGSCLGVDPLSDGEFVGLNLYDQSGSGAPTRAMLMHLPSGARETLALNTLGPVHLRGEYVMWSQAMAEPKKPWSKESLPALTQVGRLRRPSVGSA